MFTGIRYQGKIVVQTPSDTKAMSTMTISDPRAVAEAGERIYQQKYQKAFEKDHAGKYVAINIATEEAFLGSNPEDAIQKAQASNAAALLHLIRVGASGAYRVSRAATTHADSTGLFRSNRYAAP